MEINEFYKSIGRNCNDILDSSISDDYIQYLAKSHNLLFEFNIWLEILENRPEYNIFKTGLKEYQMSMIALNLGLYSQAFVGLRFFLERTLVGIMFSANEIELRLWEKGERDTYWSELMDENKGVFSPKFSKAFFPDLKDELKHFERMSKNVYRECSEYVHGNNLIIDEIPDTLSFNKDLFVKWHNKANTVKRVLLFSLNLRFALSIKANDLKKLEDLNLDEFGSIKPIQNLY